MWQVLTLSVLLSKEGLLPLQLPLSPSLCSLDLLPQTLHVALLLLYTLSRISLLTRREAGTQLPLKLCVFNTIKQAQRFRMKHRLRNYDEI